MGSKDDLLKALAVKLMMGGSLGDLGGCSDCEEGQALKMPVKKQMAMLASFKDRYDINNSFKPGDYVVQTADSRFPAGVRYKWPATGDVALVIQVSENKWTEDSNRSSATCDHNDMFIAVMLEDHITPQVYCVDSSHFKLME